MSITAPSSATGGEAARRTAGDAVVERVDHGAVGVDAVDQAGVEVGGEELPVRLVEADVADAGAAVAVDVGKQRHGAGQAVDLPDRAGTAAILLAELAFHEGGAGLAAALALRPAVGVGVGRDDADAVQRGRRRIEVRHARRRAVAHAVVIGQAEDLADLAGQHLEGLRRVDELAGRRTAKCRNVENAQGCAFGVDEGLVDRVDAGRQAFLDARDDRAGKAGDGHRAGIDDLAFLRAPGAGERGWRRAPAQAARCRRQVCRAGLPVVRLQASERSTPRLRGMMLLLPIRAGETARRDARQGAKRAVPALSPLAMLFGVPPSKDTPLSYVGSTESMAKPSAPGPSADGGRAGCRMIPVTR